MASCTTPKKSVSEKISNCCRCCSSDNTSNRVNLYGAKSKDDGIVSTIFHLTGTQLNENDHFSKWICRSCALKISTLKKKVDELKTIFDETTRRQEEEFVTSRSKRGRRETQTSCQSPTSSPTSLSMPKRTRITESRASRSLAKRFQSIAPKPTYSQPTNLLSCNDLQSTNAQQRRPLPAPFSQSNESQTTNSPPPVQSEEITLLSTCGLQALKVNYQKIYFFLLYIKILHYINLLYNTLLIQWLKSIVKYFSLQSEAESTSSLNSSQKNKLIEEIVKGSPTFLARTVMEIPQLKKCVMVLFVEDINEKCKKLCSKTKEKPSVLRVTREQQKNLAEFKWISLLREMKERVPEVLHILMAIASPRVKNDNSQVAPLCTAFGILMHLRSRELSLVQKLNTVVIGTGNATKKVWFVLECPYQYVVC